MRRGRKRLNVPRTPSGQRSRAKTAMTENTEPIATRMRLFGLSEVDARDQKAESVVGRLLMRGRKMGDKASGITEGQYDAAVEYRKQAEAYRRALSAPDSLRSPASGSNVSRSEETHARWCRTVIDKFEASRKAVRGAQCELDNRGRNLFAALDYMVLRNEQHRHMVGDLRVALNALARHYGCA